MTAIIYAEPGERNRRLRALGCSRSQLIEVVEACVAARGGCTDNDPKSAPGYEAWRVGTRLLREIFLRKEWEKYDLNGIEAIINHALKIRISLVNTDAGTGDISKSPRNRTLKGPATQKVTDLNNQAELPGIPGLGDGIGDEPGYEMWHLCVFDDGNLVRAELSCPIEFKSGFFVKFKERIFILGPGEWNDPDSRSKGRDFGQEVDIQIRRK